MSTLHLALLRGINVGGKNKLPMKDLAEIFRTAGCTDVQTYIQSGNVIFRTTPKVAAKLGNQLGAEIEKRFGHRPPFVLRTAEEFRSVLGNNPFVSPEIDEASLFVLFLADTPTASALQKLDPRRSPGDDYVVLGRDVYFRLGTGAADTKLTNAYFDSKLSTISTSRNWRTVKKLCELLSSDGKS